jgi:hypothetical protein
LRPCTFKARLLWLKTLVRLKPLVWLPMIDAPALLLLHLPHQTPYLIPQSFLNCPMSLHLPLPVIYSVSQVLPCNTELTFQNLYLDLLCLVITCSLNNLGLIAAQLLPQLLKLLLCLPQFTHPRTSC